MFESDAWEMMIETAEEMTEAAVESAGEWAVTDEFEPLDEIHDISALIGCEGIPLCHSGDAVIEYDSVADAESSAARLAKELVERGIAEYEALSSYLLDRMDDESALPVDTAEAARECSKAAADVLGEQGESCPPLRGFFDACLSAEAIMRAAEGEGVRELIEGIKGAAHEIFSKKLAERMPDEARVRDNLILGIDDCGDGCVIEMSFAENDLMGSLWRTAECAVSDINEMISRRVRSAGELFVRAIELSAVAYIEQRFRFGARGTVEAIDRSFGEMAQGRADAPLGISWDMEPEAAARRLASTGLEKVRDGAGSIGMMEIELRSACRRRSAKVTHFLGEIRQIELTIHSAPGDVGSAASRVKAAVAALGTGTPVSLPGLLRSERWITGRTQITIASAPDPLAAELAPSTGSICTVRFGPR